MSTRQTVAANIDTSIDRLGLTNVEVGKTVGVTDHAVSRWRRGRVTPSEKYLQALADVLADGDVSAFFRPVEAVA